MWVDDEPRVTVTRGGKTTPLDLRLDLARLSPSGFGWGFEGPGSAQLALAILADFLSGHEDSDSFALRLCGHFQSSVTALLPNAWAAAGWQIAEYLQIVGL